jgi:hypothetical protein
MGQFFSRKPATKTLKYEILSNLVIIKGKMFVRSKKIYINGFHGRELSMSLRAIPIHSVLGRASGSISMHRTIIIPSIDSTSSSP